MASNRFGTAGRTASDWRGRVPPVGAEDNYGIESGADLKSADLTNAKLHAADLSGATLHGADLTDADWIGVDWTGATMPDGTVHK